MFSHDEKTVSPTRKCCIRPSSWTCRWLSCLSAIRHFSVQTKTTDIKRCRAPFDVLQQRRARIYLWCCRATAAPQPYGRSSIIFDSHRICHYDRNIISPSPLNKQRHCSCSNKEARGFLCINNFRTASRAGCRTGLYICHILLRVDKLSASISDQDFLYNFTARFCRTGIRSMDFERHKQRGRYLLSDFLFTRLGWILCCVSNTVNLR